MAKKKVNFDASAVVDDNVDETKKLLSAYDNESVFSNSKKFKGSKKKMSIIDEKSSKAQNILNEEE